MSGLLANTVHQSPVVPSQRPGSATGSRPSKSHSYMVVTMGAAASSFGTWRRRGMDGCVDGSLGWGRGSVAGSGPGRLGLRLRLGFGRQLGLGSGHLSALDLDRLGRLMRHVVGDEVT